MKSFQTLYEEVQSISGVSDTASTTKFKEDINETQELVLGMRQWKFLEGTATISTSDGIARYEIPQNIDEIKTVTTTPDSGTTVYRPEEVKSREFWDHLQSLNTSSSEITEYWYIEGNDILLYPAYAGNSKTITLSGRLRPVEMTLDDYTTGTITTATNAGTTIVGDSTVWTGQNPVYNQYIRIDKTAGDYRWYPIASVTDNTTLVLEKAYIGSSISAGSSTYTIGEFPLIPSQYSNILIYRAMALFHNSVQEFQQASQYWNLYDGGYERSAGANRIGGLLGAMIKRDMNATTTQILTRKDGRRTYSSEERSVDQTLTGF